MLVRNSDRVLSIQGIKRLPYYLKFLKELKAKGVNYVPASAIADSLSIYEVQVRKDLAAISSQPGKPRVGFTVSGLIEDIEHFLGYDDVNTAVLELAKGPAAGGNLEPALPAGCGIIGAEIIDGVAKINFTSEFIRLAENSDGGRMALKALVLTCTQFEGVKSVQLFVEGEPYDPGAATLAVPTFTNVADDIVSTYIQSQTALIFDFE